MRNFNTYYSNLTVVNIDYQNGFVEAIIIDTCFLDEVKKALEYFKSIDTDEVYGLSLDETIETELLNVVNNKEFNFEYIETETVKV